MEQAIARNFGFRMPLRNWQRNIFLLFKNSRGSYQPGLAIAPVGFLKSQKTGGGSALRLDKTGLITCCLGFGIARPLLALRVSFGWAASSMKSLTLRLLKIV
jgi:hypothetical protein